ncbi:hypothetical protein GCM10023259_090900 [Thermocatellispora tengchongensis]
MFRNRPALAAELLRDAFGMPVPEHKSIDIASSDFNETTPVEYRADAVVVLADEKPAMAVVVEVQRGFDRSKPWSWPVYLASVRARMKCPAALLVVAPTKRVAKWCRKPIVMGHPDLILRPLVIGPDNIPIITDPGQAGKTPEMGVLSAMAHGNRINSTEILNAAFAGLSGVDQQQATLYADMICAALKGAAFRHWESLMMTEVKYQSSFFRRVAAEWRAKGLEEGLEKGLEKGLETGLTKGLEKGREEGRAQGEARAIVVFLEARGIAVPEETRERIMRCDDLNVLEEWARRATVVDRVEKLFE